MSAVQPNIDVLYDRARECMSAGAYEDAAATYRTILEIDRQQPMAWLALSSYAYAGGRFRAAVERARSAAVMMRESGRYDGVAALAHHLQSLGESGFAVQLIHGVRWSQASTPENAFGLAQCLGLADQHGAALELIDLAVARHGTTPMLSYLRATTLRHLGRSAEATAEYRRCLELEPAHAPAMLMLAEHDARADTAGQLAHVRRALEQVDADAPQRTILLYALFTLLDASGEDGAWAALRDGMASKRRALDYDGAREQATYDDVAALCDRAFVAAAADARPGAPEHVPIFVLGLPRTGTTLLERMLGNHSEVASAGELNDFHHQLCWQADLVAERPADPALLAACRTLDFGAIGLGYLQRTRWRVGTKRCLIDKFPRNFVYAGLIRKALPQAKLVCLLRNPMDACFSNLKELFAGDFYPYSYAPLEAADHYLRFRRLLRHWDEVMPGAILTVRYEELVREPERVMRGVLAHCGLPFERDCVDPSRNASPSATASSSQVRAPLHTRGIGAWRRYAEPLAPMRERLEAGLPPDEPVADPG